MSEENIKIIQAGFDAWNRGDYESWIGGYDETVEMHDLAESPDGTIYRGHAGLREWLAKVRDAFAGGIQFATTDFIEGDDAVLVQVEAFATGAESGVPIKMTTHCVYRLRNGKVSWTQCFVGRDEALEAAGLSE
jgi:ketosteroid isomerase-like protein